MEMKKEIYLANFRQNVLPSQGIIMAQQVLVDGYIKEVKIHWPNGCNALVDVRISHNTKQFCPNEGFLALNDITPTYPFNEWVEHSENILVEIRNTDAGFAHIISVSVTIESVK